MIRQNDHKVLRTAPSPFYAQLLVTVGPNPSHPFSFASYGEEKKNQVDFDKGTSYKEYSSQGLKLVAHGKQKNIHG